MLYRIVGATISLGTLAAPTAIADPGEPPDVSGYTAADVKDYATYYSYPATNGVQFVTPGGYRCRITYTWKANPNVKDAACWGSLAGTPFNFAGVRVYLTHDPAELANVDLSGMEQYYPPPPADSSVALPISPDAYKPLPAGSKLSYPGSATCAVTETMTVCELGDHGFVLDPTGSRTF
jgi:hypothetical protein